MAADRAVATVARRRLDARPTHWSDPWTNMKPSLVMDALRLLYWLAAPWRVGADWENGRSHSHSSVLHAMPLALRLHRGGRGWPPRGHRTAARSPNRRQTVPQGPSRTRTGLSPRPADASTAPHRAEGRRRPGLAAHLVGRGAGRDRPAHAGDQGHARGRAGRFLSDHAERLAPLRLDCLDRAAYPRLRQPQHHLRHRDLQLAQGFRLALHLRHRYRHARLRPHRLRAAVGQQSRHHLARPCHRGAEGAEARRAHDRGRPAPHGLRQARRPVAAGAPGHRPGAGARPRQPDDRAAAASIASFVARWTNGPLLVRDDTGRFLRQSDLDRGGRADVLYAAGGERRRPRRL